MSTDQKSTSPPAYEQLTDSEAPSNVCDIFLDRIKDTVNAEYNDANNDSSETKRLRNFLLYCLAVDYRAPISLTISESDREHFRELSATIWDLQGIDSEHLVHLNGQDRRALAPYFWKYLHAPCTSLGIPVESAVQIVLRYSKFLTSTGLYKGCVHGLLHNYEPGYLARKLLLDRSVLIPHLVGPGATRSKLLDSLTEVAGFYFASIKGERSSIAEGSDPLIGFKEHVSTNYTMTERGRHYATYRDKTCHAAKGWSDQFWELSVSASSAWLGKSIRISSRGVPRRDSVIVDVWAQIRRQSYRRGIALSGLIRLVRETCFLSICPIFLSGEQVRGVVILSFAARSK